VAITGTKSFTAGEVLTAANTNQYLMRGVKVFADASTRAAAYGGAGKPTLEEGEAAYLIDTNLLSIYDGSAWVPVTGNYGTIASAASIAVTASGTYLLTGTTGVSSMTGGAIGMTVTLKASGQAAGIPVVLNNGTAANNLNLRDAANLGIYAGEAVTLTFDGTKWVEIGRDLKTLLAYAEITTDVSPTATTEATANAAITLAAVTLDGATPILVTFHCDRILQGTTWITPVLYDGTSIGRWTTQGQITTSRGLHLTRRLTPSAASHTYSTRFYVDAGTGLVHAGTGGSGNDMPAYMSLTRDL
jgi:hypothetical protein